MTDSPINNSEILDYSGDNYYASLSLGFQNLNIFNMAEIYPDGKIVKLGGFTTEDEVSLKFWESLTIAFPDFKKAIVKG